MNTSFPKSCQTDVRYARQFVVAPLSTRVRACARAREGSGGALAGDITPSLRSRLDGVMPERETVGRCPRSAANAGPAPIRPERGNRGGKREFAPDAPVGAT
jgi:hypothetical protein